MQADRFEVPIDLGVERPRSRRLRVEHEPEGLADRAGRERRLAGQRLVERRPQAVDVGGCGQGLGAAARLLGGHVSRSTHDGAGQGRRRVLLVVLHPLGEAEVRDERLVVAVEQDVGGLEVSVEDRVLVGIRHGAGDLDEKSSRSAGVILETPDVPRKAAFLDQLHAEIRLVPGLSDFVDRHDVRVVELRDGLALDLEPADVGESRQRWVAHQFQGDRAAQVNLSRTVNNAHATSRQLLEYLVVTEESGCPRGEGRHPDRTGLLTPAVSVAGQGPASRRRVPGCRVRVDEGILTGIPRPGFSPGRLGRVEFRRGGKDIVRPSWRRGVTARPVGHRRGFVVRVVMGVLSTRQGPTLGKGHSNLGTSHIREIARTRTEGEAGTTGLVVCRPPDPCQSAIAVCPPPPSHTLTTPSRPAE